MRSEFEGKRKKEKKKKRKKEKKKKKKTLGSHVPVALTFGVVTEVG